jgi:hypothetical protein
LNEFTLAETLRTKHDEDCELSELVLPE